MVKLSNRLAAVASLIKSGAVVADIGCDHGYLPVWLIQSGVINKAIACDINAGPLASCKALIDEEKLCDCITMRRSDGLSAVEANECSDIIIAGMGGELIVSILSSCSYIRDKHLVLQPMTHPELVRKWLYDNGFEIKHDFTVSDGNHHYVVFDAEYSHSKNQYTDVDLFLGKISDYSDSGYFIHLLNYLRNKQKGGADYSAVIDEIKKRAQL